MQEKVAAYLAQKEQEQKEKVAMAAAWKEKRKQEHLISLGLYERVYANDESDTDLSAYAEYDQHGYYMRVPIAVTDEEYDAICQYSSQEAMPDDAAQKTDVPSNKVAVTLEAIAWVLFIAGFIGGFVAGFQAVEQEQFAIFAKNTFSLGVALACWAGAFLSGMGFLALSEIIKLLHITYHKK